MSKAAPAFACLCLCAGLLLAGAGEAHARSKRQHHGSSASGRAHLRKANALAGANKCPQAVREYTKAYDKLHDPVLLFNRAECYRRMKEDQKAAADYRAFLDEVPRAPNRAEIESRIAALEGTAAPPEPGEPKETPRETPRETKDPKDPKARTKVAEPSTPPEPREAKGPTPAAASEPSRPELEPAYSPATVAPAETEQPEGSLGPVPPTPVPAVAADRAGTAPVLIGASSAAPAAGKRASGSSHWWVFVAVGLLVAGGAAAGYVYLRPKGQSIPATDLGDYRF
jgi:hypothetical protein